MQLYSNPAHKSPHHSTENTLTWIVSSLALSLAAHAFGLYADQYAGDWNWPHPPFHSFVETAGACIGIGVAAMLLLMHRVGRGTSFNVALAFGLLAMSILDALHALVQVGETFVWLHSIATVSGGLLFAQSCLPRRWGQQSIWLALVISVSAIVFGCFVFVTPDLAPQMINSGQFTFAAKLLNIGGGSLMLLAAGRLLVSYRKTSNWDDLLFAVHCLLFGGAAIMFEQSQLWDFSWWWWHLLRLMAYGVALGFAISSMLEIQASLVRHKDHLENAFNEAEERVSELSRRFVQMENAIDHHAVCSITDQNGVILDVNEGFCTISGYRADELIGKTHRVVNSGFHPREFWKEMWNTLTAGQVWKGEVCNRRKDGALYWVAATNIPILDRDGEIERFISLRFDITKQKEAEQLQQEALEDLAKQTAYAESLAAREELANLSKSEFLANMSHEIRTPMTAILGYTDLLLHDSSTREDSLTRDEALCTIQRNGNHLLTVINDILDMSKIESGKMLIEKIPTNPRAVVADVVDLLAERAREKGIALLAKYETPVPEMIESDPTRLRQILLNLVGNGIKFTEAGKVSINVSFAPTEHTLEFAVIDSGVGMSPEQLQVVSRFEAFSQADTSTTRQFGGTGLGLTISNSLAKMLGGSLTVESIEGVGSSFTLRTNVGVWDEASLKASENQDAVANAPSQMTANTPVDRSSLDGLRILLAEDGLDNQRLISLLLQKAGADVAVVENGRLAVDRLLHEEDADFDVVLMDMQMPEMDGYEATSFLREQRYAGPIIALTANAMSHDRDKCLSHGCDEFLTKPIDRKALISKVLQAAQGNLVAE